MLKVFSLTLLPLLLLTSHAFASITPDHVTCEVQGVIVEKKATEHIDNFMGEETKRKTHDVMLNVTASSILVEAGIGECPIIGQENLFSFQEAWDRFKFKKGQCIRATSKFSGSSTFNANWIYDIEKLSVEKCAQ